MVTLPKYNTPEGTRCPSCRELCEIIPLKNDFNFAGTHCTHGIAGTHYPNNWGDPVSDCCLASIETEENWDYAYEGQDDRTPFEEPNFI